MTSDGLMQKDETIKMTEYWEQQLKGMPYLTRKYLVSYRTDGLQFGDLTRPMV